MRKNLAGLCLSRTLCVPKLYLRKLYGPSFYVPILFWIGVVFLAVPVNAAPPTSSPITLLDEGALTKSHIQIAALNKFLPELLPEQSNLDAPSTGQLPPHLSDVMTLISDYIDPPAQSTPRQVATFLTAGSAAALASIVTSQVFANSGTLHQFFGINTKSRGEAAGIPMAVFMWAPSHRTFTDMLDLIGPVSGARKKCRQPLSWRYIGAQPLNALASLVLTGKSAKVAYDATWGLENNGPDDYVGVPLFIIATFADNLRIIGDKVAHVIHPYHDALNIGAKRSLMQQRLVQSYRRIAGLPDEEVVGFLNFLTLLNRSYPDATDPKNKSWKMLLMLSYFDGLVGTDLDTQEVPVPTGYKVAKAAGSFLGIVPFASYYLGGYFTGDSFCEYLGECSEDVHGDDLHMDKAGGIAYGITAAFYGMVAGKVAGEYTGGQLYCWSTGTDSNMWGSHTELKYHSQKGAGLQAIMGVILLGGSAMGTIPKAGLASYQLFEIYAPVWTQKLALGMGSIGYGLSSYKTQIGRAYHHLIAKGLSLGKAPARGDLATLRARMQGMVVGASKAIGDMNAASINQLEQAMTEIQTAQAATSPIDLSQLGVVPTRPSVPQMTVETSFTGNNSADLQEPLIRNYDEEKQGETPRIGRMERFKRWAIGDPVPQHLAADVESLNQPGIWDYTKRAGQWFKGKIRRDTTALA